MDDAPEDRRVMLYYGAYRYATLVDNATYRTNMKKVLVLYEAKGKWKVLLRELLMNAIQCPKR